jgi:hypothetical protein
MVFVFNNLRDRSTRADAQHRQFDLHGRYASDESKQVAAVVSIVSVDAELVGPA